MLPSIPEMVLSIIVYLLLAIKLFSRLAEDFGTTNSRAPLPRGCAGGELKFGAQRAPSLKDAHSVPSHLVGEQSQQPTLMDSREQQFWAPEW